MEQFNTTVNQLLDTIASRPDNTAILVSLLTAGLLAVILWSAYRLSNTAATYQPRFAATLVALTLLSTILMELIQSNLALSLGMLGSLSIVRFRTNIHDPRDIGFIFWSMAAGLAAATGCHMIGLTGSLLLSVLMIGTRRSSACPDSMMLVIRGSRTDMEQLSAQVRRYCLRSRIKARNILADSYELVWEVSLNDTEGDILIRSLFALGGVDSVNLLAGRQPV